MSGICAPYAAINHRNSSEYLSISGQQVVYALMPVDI